MNSTNRYSASPKPVASSNPVVLSARNAKWLFWIAAPMAVVSLVAALGWLLTHA
jgi:hypothetical protein